MDFSRRETKKGVRWDARAYVKNVNGQKVRIKRSGKTKREAEAKLIQAMEEMKKKTGKYTNISVSELWSEWLESRKDYAPSTKAKYQSDYTNHIKPVFGTRAVSSISAGEMQGFLARLEVGYSVVSSIYSCLSMMMEYGRKNQYIEHNIMKDVDKPIKAPEPSQDFYSEENVLDLCKAIENSPRRTRESKDSLIALVHLCYYAGLRVSEALGVKKSDIDLEEGTITIERQAYKGELVNRVKTRGSKGTFWISPKLQTFLKDYLPKVKDNDLLIKSMKGGPMHTAIANSLLKRVASSAGLPPFHTHLLRHGYVTQLIINGVDPKTASVLARHSNITTTMNIYANVNKEREKEALNKAFGATIEQS